MSTLKDIYLSYYSESLNLDQMTLHYHQVKKSSETYMQCHVSFIKQHCHVKNYAFSTLPIPTPNGRTFAPPLYITRA